MFVLFRFFESFFQQSLELYCVLSTGILKSVDSPALSAAGARIPSVSHCFLISLMVPILSRAMAGVAMRYLLSLALCLAVVVIWVIMRFMWRVWRPAAIFVWVAMYFFL